MTWNHRVIRHDDKSGDPMYIWFGVHECFYDSPDDDIPTSWTTDAIPIVSDDTAGLLEIVKRIQRSMDQPILMIDDGKLKVWEPKNGR